MATLGEIAYLAWWREHEHGHGYDHDAWLGLPQRQRNSWQAAAEAVLAEAAAPVQEPSDEDRIRDAMTEAHAHPGRTITR